MNYLIILIFIVSIYYSFKYKFIQFKCFRKTKEILVNKKSKSAYSTFMVSLANHIGVGNIVGVTTCIIIGGAGSLFWMVIFAVFSSVFSIIENTLSLKYRENINGEYRGGASYYIYKGLNYKILAIIIAVFLVLCNTVVFQPLQVNTITNALNIGFGISYELIFLLLALFSIIFIFRGTKTIVRLSEIIVPIMSVSFLLITITVILINVNKLPFILWNVIKEAFNIKSVLSGGLIIGFKRSLFSHEAGLGTAPTISAMSNEENYINQGYVQCFGVFFDTVIMCFLTGIMILIFIDNYNCENGYQLIVYIFQKIFYFNERLGLFVAIIFMFSFGLATIISQYYIGESNLYFLSRGMKKDYILTGYKMLYIFGLFIGVFLSLENIFNIIDYGMIVLGIINIFVITKLNVSFNECLDIKKSNKSSVFVD